MASNAIVIRRCTTLAEIDRCVEIQKVVWGEADLEVAPSHVFVMATKTGGQVLGAFEGALQVGFVLAFAAIREGRAYLHSHMTAVLPAYQNRKIGRLLKRQQREEALSRGLDLIEWTFDPLELRNAHFNLNRLGVIVRRFLPDVYGRTTSPLHAGLPTDRLVAEWWLQSPRVETALSGKPVVVNLPQAIIAIPAEMDDLKRHSPQVAAELQARVRSEFQHWLGQGLAVTGFELKEDAAHYLFEKP